MGQQTPVLPVDRAPLSNKSEAIADTRNPQRIRFHEEKRVPRALCSDRHGTDQQETRWMPGRSGVYVKDSLKMKGVWGTKITLREGSMCCLCAVSGKLGAAQGDSKQEEVSEGEVGYIRYFETIFLGYKDQ